MSTLHYAAVQAPVPDINHDLIKHDGAWPHDEEGDGHTGCDDNKVAKGVVFFKNSLNSNTSAMSNVLAHSTNAGNLYLSYSAIVRC